MVIEWGGSFVQLCWYIGWSRLGIYNILRTNYIGKYYWHCVRCAWTLPGTCPFPHPPYTRLLRPASWSACTKLNAVSCREWPWNCAASWQRSVCFASHRLLSVFWRGQICCVYGHDRQAGEIHCTCTEFCDYKFSTRIKKKTRKEMPKVSCMTYAVRGRRYISRDHSYKVNFQCSKL